MVVVRQGVPNASFGREGPVRTFLVADGVGPSGVSPHARPPR